MKKSEYLEQAKLLFVEDGLSLTEISGKIDVSVRTLSAWKKEGYWAKKRKSFIDLHTSTNEKMYLLAQRMIDNAMGKEDKEGNLIDPSPVQVNMIAKLTQNIPKMKNVETIRQEETDRDKPKGTTFEQIANNVDKFMMGDYES